MNPDTEINKMPNLRKITCKVQGKKHFWTASFYGDECIVDGRKTREPDTKYHAESFGDLIAMITLGNRT